MTKTFVLDTNVLLHDTDALLSFKKNDVSIPITVLEELDTFKTNQGEIGRTARATIRAIDELRAFGSLAEGVPLGNGHGVLRVLADNISFNFKAMPDTADNYILGAARRLTDDHEAKALGPVILVTRDVNLRVKADALGITAENYESGRVDPGIVGAIKSIQLDGETISRFYDPKESIENGAYSMDATGMQENDCFIGTNYEGNQSVLFRVVGGRLRKIRTHNKVGDIVPRNAEQRFLLDLLLDDRLDMVAVNGVAGSGKTLLALAAALNWLGDSGAGRRILITKAIEAVGQDIGFLPGTKEEKMMEWTKPFFDNLELLLDSDYLKMYLESKIIEVDALTYIRGRSIMKRFVIIDETQNLFPKHLKTIVSRISDSSKLILLGDLQQIDNPYLDARSCGLAYVMRQMSGIPSVGLLSMAKTERGRLARLAVQRL